MDKLKDIISINWDVVVIGTGMGGATFGYRASVLGKKVLFLEKGKYHPSNEGALLHDFAETFVKKGASAGSRNQVYADAGRWNTPYFYPGKRKEIEFTPFIGAGSGGSSALYGGAMERFFTGDFHPGKFEHDPESSIPDHWPVTYEEMATYYRIAEELYRVHGSADPLRKNENFEYLAPEKMTGASRELFDFFNKSRLNPYRLPVAYDPHEDCRGCQGFLCQYQCKNDSSKICLEPALTTHGAGMIDECDVIRLEGRKKSIETVVCRKHGKEFKVGGKKIILSAGAVMSPLILMNSIHEDWPGGIGNGSGMLGRNFMRHHIDLYAVFPKSSELPGNAKEIAFNDFYISGKKKYGTVQSFRRIAPLPGSLLKKLVKTFPKNSPDLYPGLFPLQSLWLLSF